MEKETVKETSRLAIVSMYCVLGGIGFWCADFVMNLIGAYGVAGVLFVLSVSFFALAFILGAISFAVIIICHKYTKGLIWAISAVLLSALPIMIICELELGVRGRMESEKNFTGLYNLELLGNELIKYAKNHNGYLPNAENWCDLLMEQNKKLTEENFKHPRYSITGDAIEFRGEYQFAFNKNIGGKKLSEIPGDVVLIFEADGKWNLAGGPELLKTRYWEYGHITMMLVDKSMKEYWFYEKALRKFDNRGMYYEQPRWQP